MLFWGPQGTSVSLQPPGLQPFLKKMLKSRLAGSCSSARQRGSTRGICTWLNVSESSRMPQIILIPLEPGPAGSLELRMTPKCAQGDSQPSSAPVVPPSASRAIAAGARCPTRPYLGSELSNLPFPTAWGSWGPAGSRSWGGFSRI